jgi:hypothetical protein
MSTRWVNGRRRSAGLKEAHPTEATLLSLLRVKRDLLILHLLDQSFYPVKGCLICDPGSQGTVLLDFRVDFDALLTHWLSPVFRGRRAGGQLVQQNDLELFRRL